MKELVKLWDAILNWGDDYPILSSILIAILLIVVIVGGFMLSWQLMVALLVGGVVVMWVTFMVLLVRGELY